MDVLEIKNVTYSYTNSREKILSSVNQKFATWTILCNNRKIRSRKVNIAFIISRTGQTADRSNFIQK